MSRVLNPIIRLSPPHQAWGYLNGYWTHAWAAAEREVHAYCLITWHTALEKRAAEMNRWRGSDQPKPPITKTLQSLPKLMHCSPDHPPTMAKTTKNRGRSLNCDWCERTGSSQDTLAFAVSCHEIHVQVSTWHFSLNHITTLLCTAWLDYIQQPLQRIWDQKDEAGW